MDRKWIVAVVTAALLALAAAGIAGAQSNVSTGLQTASATELPSPDDEPSDDPSPEDEPSDDPSPDDDADDLDDDSDRQGDDEDEDNSGPGGDDEE
jgi:hypothetical protein